MQSSVFRFSMTNQISLRHKLCSSYLRLSEKIKSISRFFLHRSLTKDILTLPYPSKNRLFYVQVYRWMWFWRFSGILFYTKRKAECNQHYRNNLLHSKQAYTFHFLLHLSWQNHTSKYSSKKGGKAFPPSLKSDFSTNRDCLYPSFLPFRSQKKIFLTNRNKHSH